MNTALGLVGKIAAKRMAQALYQRLMDARQARILRQVDDLIAEIGREGRSEEEIEKALAAASSESSEILDFYFRLLLTAHGEKISRTMARMTAHYFHAGKASDKFFRRFGAILSQAQDSELDRLRALVRWLLDNRQGALALELHLQGRREGEAVVPHGELRYVRYTSSEPSEQNEGRCVYEGDDEYFAVFALLKQHGFAQELAGGGLGNSHALGLLLRSSSWPDISLIAQFTDA